MRRIATLFAAAMTTVLTVISCESPVLTIITQPKAPDVFKVGEIPDDTQLTVRAVASNDRARLSYQWYSNTSENNTGGTPIVGATGPVYTVPVDLPRGRHCYFCEVRAAGALPARSKAIIVVVNSIPVPFISIKAQPVAPKTLAVKNIPSGTQLTVEAEDITTGAPLSYQWYANTRESNEGGEAIEGATEASYTIRPSLGAGSYYYFCEITAPRADTVRSDAVRIYVSNWVPSPGREVRSGGLVWAGANVSSREGVFDNDASRGYDGGLYQFNRKKGRTILHTSDRNPWDSGVAGRSVHGWSETNNPCPTGWRIPTIEEWKMLYSNVRSVSWQGGVQIWTMQDGAKLHLPAAGFRRWDSGQTGGYSGGRGSTGYYWSSTPYNDMRAHIVRFFEHTPEKVEFNNMAYSYGHSVRCLRTE